MLGGLLLAALLFAAAPDQPRVLVFSKTTGYRHDSIPAGIATIEELGRRHGFRVDQTENAARFTTRGLARYDAVIFLSTTGDPLARTEQKRALRRYVERGGGFFGIHAASDTAPGWRWYDRLIGARFRSHAAGTPPAAVRVARRRAAATRGLPALWRRADEWYGLPLQPAAEGGARARDRRRAQLLPRRQRDGSRSPDRLVPARAPGAVGLHGHGAHERVLCRAALQGAPSRQHPHGHGPRALRLPLDRHRYLRNTAQV